jgi:hypothetical protein
LAEAGAEEINPEMLMLAITSLLVGMVLGQHFKVLILAPVIVLTMLFAIGAAIMRADAWAVGETAGVAIVGLQVGYLFGIGISHLIALAHASRLRVALSASYLPPRRPAH